MTASSLPSPVSPGRRRIFAIGNGLVTLAIFVQALLAGQFVSQRHRDGWIDVHSVVANVTVVLALAVAVYAIVVLRRENRVVAILSVVLFVLLILQTVTGHLITDGKQDGWIGVHVPLALLLFGLTTWLSVRSGRAATSA